DHDPVGQHGAHQPRQLIRPGRQSGVVVVGDQAADGDAGEVVEQADDRIQHLAADIFEVDVDAIGAGCPELAFESLVTVVDGGIEAQLVHHIVTLVVGAGDADHATALELSDLADYAADRTGRGRNHHGFTFLGLPQLQQADVGGEAWHAQYAQGGADGREVRIQPAQPLAVGQRIELPAAAGEHDVSFLPVRVAGGDDLADRAAFHDFADLDRLGVGAGGAHAAAHIRVEGQINGFQQHLAFARRRDGSTFQLEMALVRHALRAFDQDDALILFHSGFSSGCHDSLFVCSPA